MSSVPLSGTNIRFLTGIPFQNDYKHTRWFESKTEQTNWFLSRATIHTMGEANFQRIEGYGYFATDKSIDELWGCNYVMFQNATYNNKWFYAFVTKLEYVQRNRTNVHFQIDVLQTWRFDYTFKPSFVLREHCHQWEFNATPTINTVDEGLNYGLEYDIVSSENVQPYDGIFFLVIVAKTAMHDNNNIKANLNGLPQPLNYYVHPFKLDGTLPVVTTTGTFGKTVDASSIADVLNGIMNQDKTVNAVVSLYVTEYFGYNATYDGTNMSFDGNKFEAVAIGSVNTLHVTALPNYEPKSFTYSNKYDGFRSVSESKLWMYPYVQIILDDFKGNRVVLKPEYINSKDFTINVKGSLGTHNKTAYSIDNYLQDSNQVYSYVTAMEHAVLNTNPNDIPILNDMLAAYLQGHRNSIQNQRNTIKFDQFMDTAKHMNQGSANALTMNIPGVINESMDMVKGGGDAILKIQGIMAKQQDISNMPPSVASMGSNSYFDYGNYIYGMFIIKKQIKPEYQKKLEDFFHMYGYKLNEVKTPNFHTRNSFNYVQTQSCTILGNFNNDDLNELKAVFDNGITLWHTDDIGNYTLANEVI
jgi:hypothetical protein